MHGEEKQHYAGSKLCVSTYAAWLELQKGTNQADVCNV